MSEKSSRSRRSRKSATGRPEKPYPEFPLYAHPAGYWAKKIRREFHYFGRWGKRVKGKMEQLPYEPSWRAALEEYKQKVDDIQAGRKPREKSEGGLTVADLCNRFLTSKLRLMESGEITARTFAEYRATTDRLINAFGKNRSVDDLDAQDFEALRAAIAKEWGPVRLGNEITRVKSVFKYGRKSDVVPSEFRKPSKSVLRRHRAAKGPKMFTQAEVRALIEAASPQLKAMILLGLNAGFGNHDCGTLPLSALDLTQGWIRFPRPKTGIERRCPLWPETVEALKAALANRPTPKDAALADLVFVTKRRGPWSSGGSSDAITQEIGKLLRRPRCPECSSFNTPKAKQCSCGWEPREDRKWAVLHRPGLGFYALRHTFRTIADAARDFPAVRLIMGHADGSIDDVYREHVEDERLRAVTDYVRAWLFPEPVSAGRDSAPALRIVG